MGLIQCLDCGAQVSDASHACVKCGRPLGSRGALPPSPVAAPSPPSFLWRLIKAAFVLSVIIGIVAVAIEAAEKRNDVRITMGEFNRISNGMDYRAVVGIVGEDGALNSGGGEGAYRIEMYGWKNGDGSNALITFTNGRVESKAQFGLEDHP